ncbi:response regulator transcription factor [Pseudonocardia sp. RS010]|uniref:response regulator transcription factor n=1 Tax=Pseudonocardia sp. RS010 TaxID=3385979 RepID=UPI00399F383F
MDARVSGRQAHSVMKACIVDDHEIVREGLRVLLESLEDPAVQVVAQVGTAAEAVAAQRQHHPDLFLVDYRLPDTTGDRLCSRLVAARPGTAVVVVSSSSAEDVVRLCLQAGAAGYVSKGAGLQELRHAIAAVTAGGERVVRRDASVPAIAARTASAGRNLTQHQLRVLELVAEGMTYGQIAHRLHVSESTVRFHVGGIKDKLGVRSKAELIVIALREALVTPAGTAPATRTAPWAG